MSRRGLSFIIVVASIVAALAFQAEAQTVQINTMQSRVNLEWFVAGLSDLCQAKDSSLKVTSDQAGKILPVLEALAEEKILPVEVPAQDGHAQWSSQGQTFVSGGGPSDADRSKMIEQQQQEAKRIDSAMTEMEAALTQKQNDYILNLNFDPSAYGLGLPGGAGASGQPASFSQADMEKFLQSMEEGQKKLVKLNQDVIDMLKKLAG